MTESHSKLLADMLESHAVHDFCLVGPKVSIVTPSCDVSLLFLLCQTSTNKFVVSFLVDRIQKGGKNRYIHVKCRYIHGHV